jgi:hypothetical protein
VKLAQKFAHTRDYTLPRIDLPQKFAHTPDYTLTRIDLLGPTCVADALQEAIVSITSREVHPHLVTEAVRL